MIAVTQNSLIAQRLHQFGQHHLAVSQWSPSKTEPVDVDQIKDMKKEARAELLVDRLLEPLKTRTARWIEGHDLAVENGALHWQSLYRLAEARKLAGPIVLISRPEANLLAMYVAQQAVTVQLQFMKPFVTGGRFVDECGELWRHKIRHRNLTRAGKFFDLFQVHLCTDSNGDNQLPKEKTAAKNRTLLCNAMQGLVHTLHGITIAISRSKPEILVEFVLKGFRGFGSDVN